MPDTPQASSPQEERTFLNGDEGEVWIWRFVDSRNWFFWRSGHRPTRVMGRGREVEVLRVYPPADTPSLREAELEGALRALDGAVEEIAWRVSVGKPWRKYAEQALTSARSALNTERNS